MNTPLTLLAVFAHPDDETLGIGATLIRYAEEGIATHLVTATRGERGWTGQPNDNPGLKKLGEIREQELREAACVLGLRSVTFLDYIDGELDQADPAQAAAQIAAQIRVIRPQVVVTFDPFGSYGHPDHIAISQLTQAALILAANPGFTDGGEHPPHAVAKLYYMADTPEAMDIYQAAFGPLQMLVDHQLRSAHSWPTWSITTQVDTRGHCGEVWRAVECHRSQMINNQNLKNLPPAMREKLWGVQRYYRVISLVNGGRTQETDLFEGLR